MDDNLFNFNIDSNFPGYNSFPFPGTGGSSMISSENNDYQNYTKNILFESRLSGGLDFYRTWSGVGNGLKATGRNGIIIGSNFQVGNGNAVSESFPLIADNSLASGRVALASLESINYMKPSNSGRVYYLQKGIFFPSVVGDNSNTIKIFTYSGGQNTTIIRDDWNIDTFKDGGLNPSGIKINFFNWQTFVIEINNNGMGATRFGFIIEDTLYYCHEIEQNNNTASQQSFGSFNKPARIDFTRSSDNIELFVGMFNFTDGCGLVSTLDTTPSGPQEAEYTLGNTAVYEFGGANNSNRIFHSFSTESSYKNISSRTPILSVRPRDTFIVMTDNWSVFGIKDIVIDSQSSDLQEAVYVEIILNGDLTGDSFVQDSFISALEHDVSATSISNGFLLYSTTVYPNGNDKITLDGNDIFSNFQNKFSRFRNRAPIGSGAGSETWDVSESATLTVVATPKDTSVNVGASFNTVEQS